MFNQLTKIKIILLLLLAIGFFVNKDFIFDSLYYDQRAPEEKHNSVILSKENKSLIGSKRDFNSRIENQVKIAFLIYDLGLMKKPLDLALSLQPQVALGFSVYSDSLSSLTRQSLELGHETLVLLPSKPSNYMQNDPGPLALFMNNSTIDNRNKFTTLVDSLVSNQVGLYLNPLSAALNSEEQTIKLLNFLEDHQEKIKFFLYFDSDSTTLFTKVLTASSCKDKVLTIDRILDKEEVLLLEEDFYKLLQIANSKGFAIGAIPATLFHIEAVKTFLQKQTEVIQLVTLGELIKNKE
jgi:polysaccharide deacetylase 2 family uncharacterized protein YibQ